MANLRLRLTRRALLAGMATAGAARAFGQEGAFHPRLLRTGGRSVDGPRASGPGRWSWELVRRTSAPARLVPGTVAADEPRLLAEPFAIWAGEGDVAALSQSEIGGLRRFLDLGGVLVVDDSDPASGEFGRAARRELRRVLPESPLVRLAAKSGDMRQEHVIFKSYYLIDRPVGRVDGTPWVEAIVRGRDAEVLFLSHDLLGALARTPEGGFRFPVEPGGQEQREYAIRFAVNLAMYVLCSNYKDDQVHAQALMRRRGKSEP
ncbi:MAG TPA: DUF4159 domain-containing protein [Polyangiaceae bacterium]|nr:DUF4159 domain-containing protein [Polyangiaceae bacterium]